MARATARTIATKTAAAAKQAAAKKAPAKRAAAKTAAEAEATPVARTAAKKTPTTGGRATTSTRKASSGGPPAKRSSAKKTAHKKPAAATAAATKAGPASKTAPTKKATPVNKSAQATKTSRAKLAVKADEKPWTKAEIDEVRDGLHEDRERLRSELNLAEHELHDLMRDAGDGAGNDQADVGSTTFERDHEMSLAKNARDMLAQTERALGRIEDGSYGVCESCGEPIGKMRLMAFPRATLCLSCKQREERR